MSSFNVIVGILVPAILNCVTISRAQVEDHCNPSPCANGGTCVERIDGFVCECTTNYSGVHCDIPDYCASSPCLNGGRCADTRTSFVCDCTGTGYEGPTCHLPYDDCQSHPCQNGGTCLDGFKTYTCQCVPGFAGKVCEVEMSACVSDPCQNGGTCVDVHAGTNPGQISPGYKCECVTGIAGDNCEINYDDCWMKPCHTGRCVDGINSYTCDCTGSGYYGIHCELQNSAQCSLQPCQNGGTCIQDKDDYHCECPAFQQGLVSHGGRNCSVLLRGCENIHTCQNGGVCVPILVSEVKNIHSYTCSCAHGYRGKLCDSVTTMSINPGSYIRKTFTKDFKLEMRFRTGEPDGVLLYYRIGQKFVSVEVVNGSLYLVSGDSITISSQEVITSDLISDSHWHSLVFDASSNVTLTLDDPLCNSTSDCTLRLSLSSFPPDVFKEIFLGHVTVSPWLQATMSQTDFNGCIQDVISNSDLIVPSNFGVAEFHNIKLSCPACLSKTCQGLGQCVATNGFEFHCVCRAGLQNGICPREDLGITCNFDKGLCKWTQGTGDQFDWTRNTGSTGSSDTGPTGDHTTGNGYYMYTEASSPRGQGDQAYLWSPYFDVSTPTCIRVWINMYGNTMGTLKLNQMDSSGKHQLFSLSGAQSQSWLQQSAMLRTSSHTRLQFVGSIGSGYYSDMAIDDITLQSGRC